jgi:hypothetical protein
MSGIVPAGGGQASPSPQQQNYDGEGETPHSNDSGDQVHQYEGGCFEEDIKNEDVIGIGMSNFNEFLKVHQQLMHERGDNFLAKVINIDINDNNLSVIQD